jgi:ribosome-binding ATPase YchF (GTP1/OBG family)
MQCNETIVFFSFSVLEKIVVQGYKALQLCYFFTAGPDEVKAWTIQVRQLIVKAFCDP